MDKLPAYYDGALQVLTFDEKNYIAGAKYKRSGDKVVIHTLAISDAVLYAREAGCELLVDYSELCPDTAEATRKAHEDLRQWSTRLDTKLEWDNFLEWAKAKAAAVTADTQDVEDVARQFFDENITRDAPFEPGGVPQGHSYVTMRRLQWDRDLDVCTVDGFLTIRRKQKDEK